MTKSFPFPRPSISLSFPRTHDAHGLMRGGRARALALCLGLSVLGCGSGNPTSPSDDGGGVTADAGGADAQVPGDGSVGAGDGGAGDSASGADSAPPPFDAGPWTANPASLVNTLVGTTGGGNTFPGADYPFGMIQWSPDTAPNGLGTPTGGYDYGDTSLKGFSLTHLSGPGCTGYGDLPILPLVGGLPSGTDPGSILEPLTHTTEVGTAGYYTLQSGSASAGGLITTELTATLHSAMARFTYPATNNANILIKLLGSQNGDNGSSATIIGSNEVQGSTTETSGFCGVSNSPTVYFDIVFDQAFTASQIIKDSAGTLDSVVFLTFDTTTTEIVQAKVAISFISAANAAANWAAENPSTQWSFDTIETAAQTAWNGLLGKIQIAGGSASQTQLFYTALYHSLLHPNVFSDANGQYLGFDGQTHMVGNPQKDQYANYSGWDIYRGQVQMSALLAPQQMSDSAQSMINDAAQNNGQLPKWASLNVETYVMVGDPADAILAGYYAFGATNFDTSTALTDMINEATTPNNIRPGLAYYETLGYLPDDGTYGCCNYNGSVSTTLEYAQADFAISQLASALGDTTHAASFLARAQNWQNLFDPTTLLFTPKYLDGTFMSGVGPTFYNVASSSYQPEFVEGSAGQYQWEEPFNRQALLTAMGGPSAVNPLLATYFSQLNDCGFTSSYACLTNEMDLGEQYWNSYTGTPATTQDIVDRLRTQVFADAPAMINNNDDLGAESSILAWSMLGIYPNYPGSAVMDLNAPSFPAALIHLPNGSTLAIDAPAAVPPDDAGTPAQYVQTLYMNGAAKTASWVDASLIQNGGTLYFTLGSSPSATWGTGASDMPPSYGVDSTAAIGFVQTSPIVIAPGAQVTANLGAASTRSDVSQTITWEVSANAGTAIGVSPTSGQLTLAPSAKGTAALTFTAPQTQGQYIVPFQMTSSTGNAVPSAAVSVIVAPAGSLFPYFNNAGISDDSTGTGNLDGAGFSYSAEALAAAGVTPGSTIAAGGINYTWPNVPVGQDDDIQVAGQTISFAAASGKTTIGLLGCATDAETTGAQGTLTVTYADSSTQSIPIAFTDWTRGGGGYPLVGGNVVAVTTAYRDQGTTKQNVTSYVYALSATLTGTAAVQSVTLPFTVTGGSINVFDVELGP